MKYSFNAVCDDSFVIKFLETLGLLKFDQIASNGLHSNPCHVLYGNWNSFYFLPLFLFPACFLYFEHHFSPSVTFSSFLLTFPFCMMHDNSSLVYYLFCCCISSFVFFSFVCCALLCALYSVVVLVLFSFFIVFLFPSCIFCKALVYCIFLYFFQLEVLASNTFSQHI